MACLNASHPYHIFDITVLYHILPCGTSKLVHFLIYSTQPLPIGLLKMYTEQQGK
jgi:hypothetical protein